MARIDPHSFTDDLEPRVTHLEWTAKIAFDRRVITGLARLTLDRELGPSEKLSLDTRGLDIHSVRSEDGEALATSLTEEDAILGQGLIIQGGRPTRTVEIRYETRPGASALQWLEPAETAGKVHPYLFSQCQAIHARSVVPLQDTPARRLTYLANLTVPSALRGLMAATFKGRHENGPTADERWEMELPIPPYLLAFAVGELASKPIGERTAVWAEPSVVDQAAWEFAEVDKMVAAAEALFGPYPWGRFDILVMPPSFPYGGMENPKLTFVTPTLLAGDRSQVRVIAHELAHAWTGNLVTNENAEHFWLNEGWTRYAELRITERVEGPDVAALLAAICKNDLDKAVLRLTKSGSGHLTKLRTHLAGIDPDEAFSTVPYDKGNLFLQTLEHAVGRPAFEAFAKSYMQTFRFQSLSTERFLAFAKEHFPAAMGALPVSLWVDGEGIPEGAPPVLSERLSKVIAFGDAAPGPDEELSGTEWNLWFDRASRPRAASELEELDRRLGASSRGDLEMRSAFLKLCLESKYFAILPQVEAVLTSVGRMKYLVPLYVALAEHEETRSFAKALFERVKETYHPIAREVVALRLGAALAE